MGSKSPRVSPHYCFTGGVPSRGGVRGDSPYEKLPALQGCHMFVFSEYCFLELLARPSIRTLLLSGFVVLVSIL